MGFERGPAEEDEAHEVHGRQLGSRVDVGLTGDVAVDELDEAAGPKGRWDVVDVVTCDPAGPQPRRPR